MHQDVVRYLHSGVHLSEHLRVRLPVSRLAMLYNHGSPTRRAISPQNRSSVIRQRPFGPLPAALLPAMSNERRPAESAVHRRTGPHSGRGSSAGGKATASWGVLSAFHDAAAALPAGRSTPLRSSRNQYQRPQQRHQVRLPSTGRQPRRQCRLEAGPPSGTSGGRRAHLGLQRPRLQAAAEALLTPSYT